MKKLWLAASAATLALTVTAVAPATTTAKQSAWFVDEEKLPFDPLPGAEALWGVRSGAGYQIEIPQGWNGELVIYAHGYRGTGLELTVSSPPIRDHLIGKGYAWAASSYSANGYVPGQGAKDSHALIQEFTRRVGRPDQVFIIGTSMGGHVTGAAIEQWPNAFDGALPTCGVMGDSELFDYFLDSYLLAEHFAGNEPAVPTPDDYYASGAHVATFGALGYFGALTAGGEDYRDALEQLTGGDRPTFDEGFSGFFGAFFPFAFRSAGTGDERGNLDTVYQLDGDPGLSADEISLNDALPRIAARPQTRHPNGLGGFPGTENDSPRINGTFEIPVISMHTLGELFVPFHMQQIYAERAAANGNEDLLVIRAIRDVRHCGFGDGQGGFPEIEAAFDDLVEWVETGDRPAGDDVLDPAVVADDDFGCQFTLFDRPGLPACP